jgi:hypothetical protein
MAPSTKASFQKIGRIIARRVITEARVLDRKITLAIGMPRRVNQGEWRCPISIEGLKDSIIEDSAPGIDSLAALLLAVECIRWHLKKSGRSFAWLGESDLWETGIPRQVPFDLGRQFEERIERAIERESQRARKFRRPILRRLLAESEPNPLGRQAVKGPDSNLPVARAGRRKDRS